MIEKVDVVDQIEVTRNGNIQVRMAVLYIDDGVEVAKTYHRHVLSPGDDVSEQDDRVAAVALAVWTPTVISEYKAKQAELVAGDATHGASE